MEKKIISALIAAVMLSSYTAINVVTASAANSIRTDGNPTCIELENESLYVAQNKISSKNTAPDTGSFSGSGYYSGTTTASDGVKGTISVSVESAGYYTVDFHGFTNSGNNYKPKLTVGEAVTDLSAVSGTNYFTTTVSSSQRTVSSYTGEIYLPAGETSIEFNLPKNPSNTLVYVIDCINFMCSKPVITSDGRAAKYEAENLGLGTTNATAPTSGSFSGTGFIAGNQTAEMTFTIPVNVEKAGSYTVGLHGYTNLNEIPTVNSQTLTKGGDVFAVVYYNNQSRIVASYTGTVTLPAGESEVTLTFPRASGRLVYIFDCISFMYNTPSISAADTAVYEAEAWGTGNQVIASVVSGSGVYSGSGYLQGRGTNAFSCTIPVSVETSGYYAVDFHGYDNITDPKITVGSTTTELTKSNTASYFTHNDATNGDRIVYSYTAEIYLPAGTASIDFELPRESGTLIWICDSIEFAYTRSVLASDGTATRYELENLNLGTTAYDGMDYYAGSRSSSALTITVPVTVDTDGLYAVDLHAGLTNASGVQISNGTDTVDLEEGSAIHRTVNYNNHDRSIKSYTGNIYLTTETSEITVTISKGSGTLVYVLDCIDFTYTSAEPAYTVITFDEVANVVSYDDATGTYSKAFELGYANLTEYNTFFVKIDDNVKGQSLSALGLDNYDGAVMLGIIITDLPTDSAVQVGFTTQSIE